MARILVVEDDDTSRDLLRRRRFEVLLAPDGYQGLALALREKPASFSWTSVSPVWTVSKPPGG